jgi:hypothetical protein
VQSIATTKTALLLGSVGTIGYVLVHNCDAINFVQLFPNSTDAAFIKLKFGEWALFRFDPSATPNAKADTAAVSLEFFLLPD